METYSKARAATLPEGVDEKAVLEQLDRILKSRHFRNSKRYPALLEYIVRRRLEGDVADLKERTLGIEIFKRRPDYDTNADPVVRITAGEVRKRIALFYHEEGRPGDVRIGFESGSYIPEFHAPDAELEPAEIVAAEPVLPLARVEPESVMPAMRERSLHLPILAGAAVVLLLLIAGAWHYYRSDTTLNLLWQPFFHSNEQPLIVMGTPLGQLAGPPQQNGVDLATQDSHSHVHLAMSDTIALTRIGGLLESHGRSYQIQTAAATSLTDLRNRPVVLVAAFGNPWSQRLLAPLRFAVRRDKISPLGSTLLGTITDQRNPAASWSFDFSQPQSVNNRDYAILAKIHSDTTDGPVVIVAGLGATGTESAGEFATSPEYLKQLASVAPPGWKDKNLELVIETQIIDGKPGHPHIVASEFW